MVLLTEHPPEHDIGAATQPHHLRANTRAAQMADEDILNLQPAPDAGTIPESTLAPSASAEHFAAEIAEAAVPPEPAISAKPEPEPAEPAETAEVTDHGSPGIAAAGNGKSWSPRPLPVSKRRPGQAVRHGNYGMTPRRFVTLRESDPKPVLAAPNANQEGSEARAARSVRRALWIIAIATAVNVGVAALQWHELHRASSAAHTVDAAGTINRASLP